MSNVHVLHIAWEYPPLIYGGLGRHVEALTRAQHQTGLRVSVLTQQPVGAAERETMSGVDVYRVEPPTPNVPLEPQALVDWTQKLDARLADKAQQLVAELQPDVVHVHDWVVAQSAHVVSEQTKVPVVATFHATESGRHQGWITTDVSKTIHATEQQLALNADRIITCSNAMRDEVSKLFDIENIDVIPNGINTGDWVRPDVDASIRSRYVADDAALLVFVGRLEWEKGVHTLIDAFVEVAATSNVQLAIAGTGTFGNQLRERAQASPAAEDISFLGRIDDTELRQLVACADMCVAPSIYEPFGLTALEAGALQTPLIGAATGGLIDIIDERTGWLFESGDAHSLAITIREVLASPTEAHNRAIALHEKIANQFNWPNIATQTTAIYLATSYS